MIKTFNNLSEVNGKGIKSNRGKAEIWAGKSKKEKKRKISNPIGIEDNSLKEKLKAKKGEGNILLGGKDYKIITDPRGEDEKECLIDDEAMLIVINQEHPAYEIAVTEFKSIELVIFRAISSAWAYKICIEDNLETEEMYDKIDEMVRYQADYIKNKRMKNEKTL